MARLPRLTPEAMRPQLMQRGPVSATDLAAALRVDRSSVVRALNRFNPGELLTLGHRRATRYMLRRPVQQDGNEWPVYLIGASGTARRWATLESLYPRHWRVKWEGTRPAWADHFSNPSGIWQGFPFFLSDLRPRGFLGRVIARRLSSTLGVPGKPESWSDDHTLVFLCREGSDVPGALVVGDGALQRAQTAALYPPADNVILTGDRMERYPLLAREAADSPPGSSAGGEQPKFLTRLRQEDGSTTPVLVKFSPPLNQPGGQRWADLLICEAHALNVLAEHGLAERGANVLDAGDRRFLEVRRFDRSGAAGRYAVVSLGALHPESLGISSRTAWIEATKDLETAGLVDGTAVSTIRTLHAFGELIGNTDMHAGNLSFWLTDSIPFRPAPAYDMLPMLWAPGVQGEAPDGSFIPAPPLPGQHATWDLAASWALVFWERVAGDARISSAFRTIAQSSLGTVRRLREFAAAG